MDVNKNKVNEYIDMILDDDYFDVDMNIFDYINIIKNISKQQKNSNTLFVSDINFCLAVYKIMSELYNEKDIISAHNELSPAIYFYYCMQHNIKDIDISAWKDSPKGMCLCLPSLGPQKIDSFITPDYATLNEVYDYPASLYLFHKNTKITDFYIKYEFCDKSPALVLFPISIDNLYCFTSTSIGFLYGDKLSIDRIILQKSSKNKQEIKISISDLIDINYIDITNLDDNVSFSFKSLDYIIGHKNVKILRRTNQKIKVPSMLSKELSLRIKNI